MLHLTAFDKEDLGAISAQAQDAVIRVADVNFDQRRRQFALVANRFAWDALPEKQRRRTGLRFNHVLSARQLAVGPVNSDTILNLLAIAFEATGEPDNPAGHVTLHFSSGHKIKLAVECIDVQMDDLGPAWETSHEPHHEI